LDLTPKELYLAIKNKEEYDGHAVKSIIRPVCEVIRLEAFWLVNLQLEKTKKIKHPSKMIKFEWDEQLKERQTPEEMKGVMRAIIRDTKNRKPKNPES
jgi:hypothetical protein